MQTNTWQIGQRICDRWEIHKILHGGMGSVYLVYDHELKSAFAAKTFQDRFLSRSPQIVARFRRECTAWIALDIHPNVVHAVFLEIIEDTPFLFLEHVTGGDLSQWIGTPRLLNDLPQALRFGIQFCDGMIHALAHGIKVHRDVKPGNCLIADSYATRTSVLQVTDFGLAKAFDEEQSPEPAEASPPKGLGGLFRRAFGQRGESQVSADPPRQLGALSLHTSRSGRWAGTPLYMAPEQFENFKHVDVRADVYSFGIMLFQMITGRLPLAGKTWEELRQARQTKQVPHCGVGPAGLGDLIRVCLATDPGNRPADFVHVRERLACVLEDLTGVMPPKPSLAEDLNLVQVAYKGVSLSDLGRYPDAIACFDKVLSVDPKMVEAWACKGEALAKMGRASEALSCFDHALSLEIDSVNSDKRARLWRSKGDLLAAMGKPDDALSCFKKAASLGLTSAPAAGPQLRINARDVPQPVEASTSREPDLASTVTAGSSIPAANSQPPGLSTAGFAPGQAAFERGIALVNKGQHHQGLSCLEEAERQGHPHAGKAAAEARLILKVVGLAQAGQRDQARISLAQAQQQDRRLSPQLIAQLRQTVDSFPEGEFVEPTDKHGWNEMGATLVEAGKLWEAAACFKKAIDIDPHYEIAWLNLGLALAKFKQYKDALTVFDRLLTIKPSSVQAWNLKGMVMGNLERHAEALACYDRCLALDPRLTLAWVNKGGALDRLKRPEEAIECCNRAIELDPRNYDGLRTKARALLALGRKKEAQGCMAQLQLINPDRVRAEMQSHPTR